MSASNLNCRYGGTIYSQPLASTGEDLPAEEAERVDAPIRWDRVRRAKGLVALGFYDQECCIEACLELLLRDL